MKSTQSISTAALFTLLLVLLALTPANAGPVNQSAATQQVIRDCADLRLPVPQAAVTSDPATMMAVMPPEQVVTAFLESFKQKNFKTTTSLYSDDSLQFLGLTREAIVNQLEKWDFSGWKLVEYRVGESRILNDHTALVHVLTKPQEGDKAPQVVDQMLALHLENGQWRINLGPADDDLGNMYLVDDIYVNVASQTIRGVSIRPWRLVRYTTQIRIIYCLHNRNNKDLLWAWGNEILATFHFGTNQQDVRNDGLTSMVANRIYPDSWVRVKGLYDDFPTAVDLRNWSFASPSSSLLPENPKDTWSYSFQLR